MSYLCLSAQVFRNNLKLPLEMFFVMDAFKFIVIKNEFSFPI